eukprot:CAMPEP_0197318480 /NCGR_PEP_ID=MMETSP0891-20130614/51295_1 /TAXON_ID=44058 ORGANISM="Aureoumbra lagunensis, Strain CCMP1510" /NCGR_SAMPLE_ID=MMETSP0891 /ASSEMBLY_ACC=CAM_ASM_000534 /LENGTH=62 /DNA_ID=CAMNT_0042808979 /DNA_START=909 /DNA_END=1097 /DNA_ORIENTATION=+
MDLKDMLVYIHERKMDSNTRIEYLYQSHHFASFLKKQNAIHVLMAKFLQLILAAKILMGDVA